MKTATEHWAEFKETLPVNTQLFAASVLAKAFIAGWEAATAEAIESIFPENTAAPSERDQG